jgi:uncharacterized repeat protein (TIGR03803 family)
MNLPACLSRGKRLAFTVSLSISFLAFAPLARGQMVTVVHAFIRTPCFPGQGSMAQATDGYLWGTATNGGDYNCGAIFKVKPDGTDWQTVVSFSGTGGPNRGNIPASGLIRGIDGNFYGTTAYGGTGGGASGFGTLFMITPAGVLTTLHDFTGSGAGTGATPMGGLVQLGNGDIYGTTEFGGTGNGSVFRLSGGIIQTLVNFTSTTGSHRGANPVAALMLADDGNLYGTTSTAGSGGHGTVFQLTTAGAITTLVDFTSNGATNRGDSPMAPLVQGYDHLLYGTTQKGGAGGFGTLFKMTTAGVLTTLVDFTGNSGPMRGSQAVAPLLKLADGSFLGGTQYGGNNSDGTIFNVTSNGTFTTLIDLTGNTTDANRGTDFTTGFILGTDGNYYAATQLGGINNLGTVLKLTSGGVMTTLSDFVELSANDRGMNPWGGLTAGTDGYLYGMTTGGGSNQLGTVFKIGPDGVLTTLVEFAGGSGANRGSLPYGGLTWGGNGFFYGATSRGDLMGGANDNGTLFKMTPAGVLTTLVDFTDNGATKKGAQPYGNLVLAGDGNLYGITLQGGTGENGTVFRLNPTTGALTTVVLFTGGISGNTRGMTPYPGLFLGAGGIMYGTTSGGGANATGTAFSITTGGTITTIADFGSSGTYPYAGFVLGNDGLLYGSTVSGGVNDVGTLFKMTTTGSMTTVVNFTDTTGGFQGSSPYASLVKDSAGNFYGTTYAGGANGMGTVFEFSSGGVFTTLASLTGDGSQANCGAQPGYGPLCIGPSGNIYGTTTQGGPHGAGIIYRINLVSTVPKITAFAAVSANTTVNAKGAAGVTYFLQSSDNLPGPWSLIGNGAVADGSGNVQFTDTRSPLAAQRFYRVISGP